MLFIQNTKLQIVIKFKHFKYKLLIDKFLFLVRYYNVLKLKYYILLVIFVFIFFTIFLLLYQNSFKLKLLFLVIIYI